MHFKKLNAVYKKYIHRRVKNVGIDKDKDVKKAGLVTVRAKSPNENKTDVYNNKRYLRGHNNDDSL